MKTVEIYDSPGEFMIDCPACGHSHSLHTSQAGKPHWTFNGDLGKPTFFPSLRVEWWKQKGEDPMVGQAIICHSFITDGRIQFLGDCTHDLKGQTIELPDID